SYVDRFCKTLERMVADKSISVRSCVASALLAVSRHAKVLALDLFDKLVAANPLLLTTRYVDRFIYHALHEDFSRVRPFVEQMLRSKEPKLNDAGARLASLAALHHEGAADLVREAMAGNPAHRLGVARVAASNLGHADCRDWSEKQLLVLFN